ncbi:hypothetical protein AK88_04605 [Plasmodium fragile]|uniref:N-acetylglucosaminylphosphatidylinositol deacetylase n=1 Tax=Plasmodium fragile TaxID=5857 RepID=A0A0D9QFC4_PLAFR|nr:uncharacterized protein AK88_04605 [Plasmodium fragile]KJP85735.1 hypothetical protein AK88_04605 [Plasmodium fragile]
MLCLSFLQRAHTYTPLSFLPKPVIIEDQSTSSTSTPATSIIKESNPRKRKKTYKGTRHPFSTVVPEEQPAPSATYPRVDMHAEGPRATTSSRYNRFFKKKAKESKELINSYLDSILDSDMLIYYEQNAGSIHSEDMDVENLSDELCIQTYVMSAHLMVYGDEFQKKNAYMNICRDCHHFFVNKKECLDNSINMSINTDSETETVIKVPLLGLKYEKSRKSNQSLVVNFPVTYVLSRLTSSLVNMDSYTSKNMSASCDILQTKLKRYINQRLIKIPNEMGIFSNYISCYRDNFNNEMSNKRTDTSNPLHSCKELLNSFEHMRELTYSFVNKSSKKYLEHQNSKKRMESFVFSIFNLKYRESDTSVHIKLIYDFYFNIHDVIERIRNVYNEEIRYFFLKDLETPQLFFLRNNSNIKNICSINIIATISWFFNQVNMGIYNKNKTVPELFMEKFSSKNIENIVKMENVHNNVPRKNVMDLCLKTMTEMVDMFRAALLDYHKENLSELDEEIQAMEKARGTSSGRDTPRPPSPASSSDDDTIRPSSAAQSSHAVTPRAPSAVETSDRDTPRAPSAASSSDSDTPRPSSSAEQSHGDNPQTSSPKPMSYPSVSLPSRRGYIPDNFSSTSSVSPSPSPPPNEITKKFTFANMIKYAEVSLLNNRLSELLENTSDHGSSYESHIDRQSLQRNLWARENFICLMKIFSSKMNSHISELQNSFLQKLTLENYKLYSVLHRPLDDREHMYFCTFPGEYLIHKIVSYKFFFMINIYKQRKKELLSWLQGKENIIFVIAHPDDEIMFFFPTIKLLFDKKKKEEIFLLSLTNGNFYGQGKIREKELYHVWSYIGGVKNNCKIVNHPDIQDSSAFWNEQHLADILADYCKQCNIRNVSFSNHTSEGQQRAGDTDTYVWVVIRVPCPLRS